MEEASKQFDIHEALSKFFPPPKYLTMPAVGLDISDEALKFIELVKKNGGIRLGRYGKTPLPKGVIVGGAIKNREQIVELLRELRKENNFSFAHVSLPEEHAYLFQTEVPSDTPFDQLRTVVEFKLKENVPLAPEEAVFDFTYVPHSLTRETRKVAVAVYPREIVESYSAALDASGIQTLSLETEGEANARAIVPRAGSGTIMIVDIGKLATELSIVQDGIMAFTTLIEVGGEAFTNTIEKFMQVSAEEAEKIKAEKGFEKSKDNIELFEVLLGVVSVLRDEINKNLSYWQMNNAQGSNSKPVEKIVLCGGGANLKGLKEYMLMTMDIPIEEANVWENITGFEDYVPRMKRVESLAYTTSIGLALRSVMRQA